MRFRTKFLVFSVVCLAVCLLGSWAVPALGKESESPQRASSLRADDEYRLYERLSRQLEEGLPLTDAEKEEYLDLESRYGDDRGRDHALDNQGGPDAFQYMFMDNVPPDNVPYEWIELRDDPDATWIGGYTHFTSPDDGYSRQKVPIGFPFPFYGVAYDCVRVMCNGLLNFTTTSQSLTNACLPASAVNAPMIAVFWDDLHQVYGGRADTLVIGYKNFGDYFVIQFDEIGFYSTNCRNVPLKFEAILYAGGSIKLQYHTITPPASCENSQTIGIQQAGAAGSAALNYVCNTTGIQPQDGRAILFLRATGIPRPVTGLTAQYVAPDVTLTWTDPTQDTQGNPITITNVQVWLGQAQTGVLLATVNPGEQSYTHVNAPDGRLVYTVRPFNSPYYGAGSSVSLTLGSPAYTNNFNSNNGGWVPTPATDGWEYGIPWTTGIVPHSLPGLWGTIVAGNYRDNACWSVDLDSGLVVTSPAATVEFWHWFNSQASYDGCNFKVSVDNGGTWTILTPTQGGYNTTALSATTCMTGEPAWAGTTPQAWQRCVIPIGQYVGQIPIFRFEFSTNASTSTTPGFYFDDLEIWGVTVQGGIPQACTNLVGNYDEPDVILTWTDPILDSQGNPLSIDSVQVWLGFVGSGTRLGSVQRGVQTFTHHNPPIGFQTYSVRAYHASLIGPPVSATVVVGNPGYVSTFEANDGGWTASIGSGWSWGTPTNTAAPTPHSGTNLWGTGLVTSYDANACWQLDLDSGLVVVSPTATVEFWYWYDSQLTYDGCNFKVSADNGATWNVLTPAEGAYNLAALSTTNTCMGGQPAWSNTTPRTWQYAVIPVGEYLGQSLILRFEFSSNSSTQYTGFFFDDLIIWGMATPPGVPGPCTNLAGNYAAPNVTLTWTDPTTDTQGNPLAIDSVQVWLGGAGTGTFLGSVVGGAQTFTHLNAPIGFQTYTIRPRNDGYFGTPTSIRLMVGNPSYWNDFETNNGNWVADPATGGWEWGIPTYASGPPTAYSGTKVWGTVLGGVYPASSCFRLTLSPNLVVTSPDARVEFYRWWYTEQSYDGVNFKVSVDGGNSWTLVQPVDNYPYTASTANVCIPGEPYWAGTTNGNTWTRIVLPLGQFVGQTPMFRLTFGSDGSVQYAGFYFDDMLIWGLQPPVGIPRPVTNLNGSYVAPNVVLTWTDPNQDMTGQPLTPDSVQIWLGTVTAGQRIGAVGRGVQTFTHVNAPAGNSTYTVRAFSAGNAGTPASVTLVVGNPSYVNNFELDNGQWVSSLPGGIWQWGTPTVPTGGPQPHSGASCWGTALTGTYPTSSCEFLDLNLGLTVVSPSATVEFWYWVDCEGTTTYDGANFKASTDGGSSWTLLTPQAGYNTAAFHAANVCTPGEAGWSRRDSTWRYAVIPIGQFVGQTPVFRFTFGSDPSVQYRGFFFDDMQIWGLRPPTCLAGTVRAFITNLPIADARVWAEGWPDTAQTNATGYYELPIDAGTYAVTFDHLHFCDTTHAQVVVTAGVQTTRDAVLRRPLAQIGRTSIAFLTFPGLAVSDTFRISNTGGQCPLDFTIADTSEWLTAQPAGGRINPNQSVVVTVNAIAPQIVGDYMSALVVSYNAVGTPWVIPVDLSVADAAAEQGVIPTEFAYYPNYPNPFNAQTSLRFDVPQQCRVQIVVYNIVGQEVARPVDGPYAPGRYHVLFDARDLPSGAYLVRMSAAHYTKIGKMMLLK